MESKMAERSLRKFHSYMVAPQKWSIIGINTTFIILHFWSFFENHGKGLWHNTGWKRNGNDNKDFSVGQLGLWLDLDEDEFTALPWARKQGPNMKTVVHTLHILNIYRRHEEIFLKRYGTIRLKLFRIKLSEEKCGSIWKPDMSLQRLST